MNGTDIGFRGSMATLDEAVERRGPVTDTQLQVIVDTDPSPHTRLIAEQLLIARAALRRIAAVRQNEDAGVNDLTKCTEIAVRALSHMNPRR